MPMPIRLACFPSLYSDAWLGHVAVLPQILITLSSHLVHVDLISIAAQ